MSTEIKLNKDDEADSVDSTKYQGMIRSLLYLTASKPDIMFSVCLCARFQENPKTAHLEAVKRIFRYIRGTTHLGLWYSKETSIETIVYADSDHAGNYVDRKSTSGVFTFMGCCLTSWFFKKQTALAIFTTAAEYVSTGKACQQALWMEQALIDYDIRLDDVLIMCDNKGAIDLIIMEYLVKISKKARILELKTKTFEDYYFDIQYAISIKEDMAYLYLHFTKDHKGSRINMPYPEKTNTPYSSYGNKIFWKISNVVHTPRNPRYAVSTSVNTPYRPFSRPYK
ncbi:hypothetical protein Tco_0886224 [Tanacetum coccineum]